MGLKFLFIGDKFDILARIKLSGVIKRGYTISQGRAQNNIWRLLGVGNINDQIFIQNHTNQYYMEASKTSRSFFKVMDDLPVFWRESISNRL